MDQERSTASSSTEATRLPFFDALAAVARRKLNAPPEWEWYQARRIGARAELSDTTLVKGGIPNRGKNGSHLTGRGRWKGIVGEECVVLDSEMDAACAEYERDTGNCAKCAGNRTTLASVSVAHGRTYRACRGCGGSGRASVVLVVDPSRSTPEKEVAL